MAKLKQVIATVYEVIGHERLRLILGISPTVFDMSDESGLARERIFPRVLNAYSDFRVFYNVNRAGVPAEVYKLNATLAGHGLVHVDHRLLSRQAQELSIMVSCSLVGAKSFIPPFNKFNSDTEAICREHGIHLFKFEDGWKHLGFQRFDPAFPRWYFHTHDFDHEQFTQRFLRPAD